MKLLHTSDWHLGQSFMGQSRLEEHYAFLEWLLTTIKEHKVDVLIVAGDIFDTATPPNYALELYYNFLTKLSLVCPHIIIIAGNHDSIATLKAPKQLLASLHIDVIVTGDEEENEVVPMYNDKQELEAIVCGVPFLRDYVVRKSVDAQTLTEKELALTQGVQNHYKEVYEEALKLKGDAQVPIIATGHFTTLGTTTSDSERDIYIGTTLNIESGFLQSMFDYVALGHLHVNQKVGSECVRYSGSPIPLSFSEANNIKKVNIVSFERLTCKVQELEIPLYRKLIVLRGKTQEILQQLETLQDKRVWVEVHLRDTNPFYANDIIRSKAKELGITLLAVKIQKDEVALNKEDVKVLSLDELSPLELFEKRLEKENIEDKALFQELRKHFQEIVDEVTHK